MRAEELVARCAARGLDLVALAKGETAAPLRRREAVTFTRFKQRCVVLQELPSNRVNGKPTRGFADADWSVEDLAQAASGLPMLEFKAACYAWAGQSGLREFLHDELLCRGIQLRRRYRWPLNCSGHDGVKRGYLERLCSLVLDEDGNAMLFALDERIPAIYCEVTVETWQKGLLERYLRLRDVYWGWLTEAAQHIQPRLEGGGF